MKRLLIIVAILTGMMLTACSAPAETPQDLSEFEDQIALLETQLSEKESTIQTLKTQVVENETTIQTLKTQVAENESIVTDLEIQVEEKSKQISALEKRVAELEELLEEATAPAPTPTTFEPIIITGSGDKTSSPFTVTTREWIIDWSYKTSQPDYAMFSFFVYPRGETALFVESVLFPSDTSGSTYSYAGAGGYYIKVLAANITSWTIIIRPAS